MQLLRFMIIGVFISVLSRGIVAASDSPIGPDPYLAGSSKRNESAKPLILKFSFYKNYKLTKGCYGAHVQNILELQSAHWIMPADCFDTTSDRVKVYGYIENLLISTKYIVFFGHPNYNETTKAHNIAVVSVPHYVSGDTGFEYIEMPSANDTVNNKELEVYEYHNMTLIPKKSIKSFKTQAIDSFWCKILYPMSPIKQYNMCASGWFAKGLSEDDYGVPLIVRENQRFKMMGLANIVRPWTHRISFPMEFLSIHPYLDWINSVIKTNSITPSTTKYRRTTTVPPKPTTNLSQTTPKSATEASKSTTNPAITTADASKTTTDPAITTKDASKTTSKTATTTSDASKTTSKTATTSADASKTTTDPAITTKDASKTTSKPVTISADASKTTSKPATTTSDASETTTDPAITTSDASKTTTDPAITTSDASKTTSKPATTTSDTSKTRTNPARTTIEASKTTTNPAKTLNEASETTTNPSITTETSETTPKADITTTGASETTANPVEPTRRTTKHPPIPNKTTQNPHTTEPPPFEGHDFSYSVHLNVIKNRTSIRYCGGAQIGLEWVLTAAECLHETNAYVIEMTYSAVLVSYKRVFIYMKVATIAVHPEYNPNTKDNNIALIKCNACTEESRYKLPTVPRKYQASKTFEQEPAVVTAVMDIKHDNKVYGVYVHPVKTKIVSPFWCKVAHFFSVGKNHICASRLPGRLPESEIGAPLVIKGYLLGIVQLVGIGTSIDRWPKWIPMPMVFTRVEPYSDWILNVTKIK